LFKKLPVEIACGPDADTRRGCFCLSAALAAVTVTAPVEGIEGRRTIKAAGEIVPLMHCHLKFRLPAN